MPDRATFLNEVSATFDFLLMQPNSATQKYATLALAALLLIFSLSKLHKWGKAQRSGFFLSLLVVAVSIFFLLVAAIWGGYGVHQLGLVPGQELAGLAILLGIAFFAGVAPLTRFCFKAAYFTSVAAWILSVCLVAGMIYFSKPLWKSARTEADKTVGVMERRN